MKLVATTDAALDGVHFDLALSPAADAGWKALAMNLSDLAAAGARPRWFLCALGVPKRDGSETLSIARDLGRGMARLARESGVALVGGNITSALQWSMTITALGEARGPLTRGGASPGDRLVLIGALGEAALGLSLLRARAGKRGKSAPGAAGRDSARALAAQLRPHPQVAAGLIAARFASASIDLSDGLLADLGHLCERSGVGAELDCARLPRSRAVREAEARAAQAGEHPYALSLAGGEDYALLVAVPERRAKALLIRLGAAKLVANDIGRVVERPRRRGEAIRLVEGTRAVSLPARRGFDHLA